MLINQEKQEILNIKGSVLVIANPGTGKTLLLAHKYFDLISRGINPDQILCLTFTEKAKKEMESSILKILMENKVKIDFSKMRIFTFHSYALDAIGRGEIFSSNLLRYAIYRYIKDNGILTYGDDYLISDIVPKLENAIRYLKTFGILPENIVLKDVKELLIETEKFTKEELDKFAEYFIAIYSHYEQMKEGIDYADMLLEFMKLEKKPKFEHVLVDELQDVNKIEAEIALSSGKEFFAVGDKKQAIFGFQGGSIMNFRLFKATQKVLSENFRSTDEILSYARDYFSSRTKEKSHKQDLKDLRNADNKRGEKPVICEIKKPLMIPAVCALAQKLKNAAIITRKNFQIQEIAKELKNRGIEFSATYFAASDEARGNIIAFIKGVFSNDIRDTRNAMFTPFFPCSLKDAFSYSRLKLDELLERCPEFRKLRENVKNTEDVSILFNEKIIPVCIAYGKEYLYAAVKLNNAFAEAIKALDEKTIDNMTAYLSACDMLGDDSKAEKGIIVSTVHKAKGRQFENVIYLPSETRDKSSFADIVVEAILESKGIDIKEEIEEESLRIDFVAFTRAKEKLVILTDKASNFMNGFSSLGEIDADIINGYNFEECKKRAFNLFVNKEFEKAKELLENKKAWLRNLIKEHFKSLDHISYSSLKKPYEYLVEEILGLKKSSPEMDFGSKIHQIAKNIVMDEEFEELKPYSDNIIKLLSAIKKDYPDVDGAEIPFKVPVSKLIDTKDSIMFKGKIDAVLKNKGNYLIADWKTNKEMDSEHRQQLSAYKKARYPDAKVCLCYVALRKKINIGVECCLDMKQPDARSFNAFSKRLLRFLEWRRDPESFINDFIKDERDDVLWRSIVEQYEREK